MVKSIFHSNDDKNSPFDGDSGGYRDGDCAGIHHGDIADKNSGERQSESGVKGIILQYLQKGENSQNYESRNEMSS